MFDPAIVEMTRNYAQVAGIPERVGLALIWAESQFDPNAYRHTSPEDHSIGLGQQTFRWSEFWRGSYNDPAALEEWRQAYLDPEYALDRAFRQMQSIFRFYDTDLGWLCRYNKRDGRVTPAVRQRYADGLAWADHYLATREEPTVDTGHVFSGGFELKAQELQAAGEDPGVPLTGEEAWGSATVQVTTTGLMVYVSPGSPLFLADIGQS